MRQFLKVENEFLICPISLDLMIKPVVADDGQTYEENSIKEHFQHSHISPITR